MALNQPNISQLKTWGKRHLGEIFFLQLMRPLWFFLDLLSQNSKIFAKFQQNCTVLFFLGVISKFRYITHRNTCISAIITTSNCLLLYNPMHNLNNLIKTAGIYFKQELKPLHLCIGCTIPVSLQIAPCYG